VDWIASGLSEIKKEVKRDRSFWGIKNEAVPSLYRLLMLRRWYKEWIKSTCDVSHEMVFRIFNG
jgi:hypothetical protein